MMWQFILIGDIIVMGMMIALVAWMSLAGGDDAQRRHMRIPLDDESLADESPPHES
ncbi:MAG: hypothetical protein ACR2P7_09965 [bacterium]